MLKYLKYRYYTHSICSYDRGVHYLNTWRQVLLRKKLLWCLRHAKAAGGVAVTMAAIAPRFGNPMGFIMFYRFPAGILGYF